MPVNNGNEANTNGNDDNQLTDQELDENLGKLRRIARCVLTHVGKGIKTKKNADAVKTAMSDAKKIFDEIKEYVDEDTLKEWLLKENGIKNWKKAEDWLQEQLDREFLQDYGGNIFEDAEPSNSKKRTRDPDDDDERWVNPSDMIIPSDLQKRKLNEETNRYTYGPTVTT